MATNKRTTTPKDKIVDKIKESGTKKTLTEKLTEVNIGDAVKSITNAMGIETCNTCEERRQKMNNMFSWLLGVRRDLTIEEIAFIEGINTSRQIQDGKRFFELFNSIFGTRYTYCDCGGLAKELLTKINKQIIKQNILTDDISQDEQ